MKVLDWQIQDYALGGLLANYTVGDLTTGMPNFIVEDLNFKPDLSYTDKYFKTGDAILYDNFFNPLLPA